MENTLGIDCLKDLRKTISLELKIIMCIVLVAYIDLNMYTGNQSAIQDCTGGQSHRVWTSSNDKTEQSHWVWCIVSLGPMYGFIGLGV